MRKLIIVLLLLKLSFLFGQKQIYITLDVSGSMNNQKYEYATYGAQIIQILNKKNQVTLISGGNKREMKGVNAYKKIQKKIKLYNNELEDVIIFSEIFNPDTKNQELFIIGDGFWGGNTPEIQKSFIKCFNSGNLRITFLEILNNKTDVSPYELFLKDNNLAKIYKTDNDANLTQNINTIVEEITGVSSLDVTKIKVEKSCVTIQPEVNIKKVIVLYQDNSELKNLPKVKKVTIDGIQYNADLVGEPSTEKYQRHGGLISSKVYEVKEQIAGGTPINLCFNKNIDVSKLRIFPITDIQLGNLAIDIESGKAKRIDENSIGVCEDNTTASVKVDFRDESGVVTGGAIKDTKVTIISNGKKYKATFKSGNFVATIPLTGRITSYRVESELKGYFRRNSGEKKIVKVPECERTMEVVQTGDMDIGTFTLDEINRGQKKYIKIKDAVTGELLNPHLFDISVDNNYSHLFKDVKVDFEGDEKIVLTISPRGFWCDCFIPDYITLNFSSKPKQKRMLNGKYYKAMEVPLKLKIIKVQSLLIRCKWLIISIIGSLFLMWFFIKLSRKKRFRRGAKIVFKSPSIQTLRSINKKYISTDYKLRKKGFLAWINRWLNPFGTENNTLAFHKAGNFSFQFFAGESFMRIEFPKNNFRKQDMSFGNYDEDSRDKFVKFDENGELTLKNNGKSSTSVSHYLAYNYPKRGWNDVSSFRWFTRVLVFILMMYTIVATFLLLKTIFNFY